MLMYNIEVCFEFKGIFMLFIYYVLLYISYSRFFFWFIFFKDGNFEINIGIIFLYDFEDYFF